MTAHATHPPADWALFIAVTLIWSTTPLAIVVSNQNIDPFLSLAARMLLSLLALSAWYLWTKRPLPLHREAWPTHVAVGVIGIGFSMALVYVAAQKLPSSWIALIFGLAPVFTGLLEALVFRSLNLTGIHWLGIACATGGLWLIFHDPDHSLSWDALWYVVAMLASTFLHALSASLVKRLNVNITPVDTVMGGLMISLPMILVFWWLNGALWPETIAVSAQLSILYLGVIGSLAGFLLYYQVLSRFSATLSSFITLIAPTLALVWGSWLQNEPITSYLMAGALLILLGLTVFIIKPADKG